MTAELLQEIVANCSVKFNSSTMNEPSASPSQTLMDSSKKEKVLRKDFVRFL